MNIKTVSQTKPSVALNNFPQFVSDAIRFKLVTVSQTNPLQNVALAAQPVCAQNPDSHPSKVYPSHNESSAT